MTQLMFIATLWFSNFGGGGGKRASPSECVYTNKLRVPRILPTSYNYIKNLATDFFYNFRS